MGTAKTILPDGDGESSKKFLTDKDGRFFTPINWDRDWGIFIPNSVRIRRKYMRLCYQQFLHDSPVRLLGCCFYCAYAVKHATLKIPQHQPTCQMVVSNTETTGETASSLLILMISSKTRMGRKNKRRKRRGCQARKSSIRSSSRDCT
ncbi:hypothetical protein M5689_022336 [Euphorbia peplus]|nr:hypothetical protein M5689_022336 [Euphorbia peplus]